MQPLDSIDGMKTYIGGVGFILWGIADILIAVYEGKPVDFTVSIGKILAGWSIIGGRSAIGKIE